MVLKLFQTFMFTLREEIIDNVKDVPSKYIISLIPYFLWIYSKLYISSPSCFFPTICVKPLINTSAQIDLIRKNIAKKLELKLVGIKTL